MHLNILLNRINWNKTINHLCCVCTVLIFTFTVAQAAENQAQIEIGAMTYSDTGVAVDVTVKFEDMSLYNDQVYLSYHIVDDNGEEILFENQRIPVNLDAAFMTVFVDCVNLEELTGRDSAVIQFDLVDQKNIYWFSRKTDIAFQAASVIFDRDLLQSPSPNISKNAEEGSDEITTSKKSDLFSIILNVIAWVVIVRFAVSIKQTQRRT